jgi:membrane protein
MPATPERVHHFFSFLRYVVRRLQEDRCSQVAGSLTFTTLLSLVPLATIALTFISAFPVFTRFVDQVKLFVLQNMVPATAGKIITDYMQQFSENAARLTAVGIAFLAGTAIALMFTIDNAFNAIWRVKRLRPWLHRFLIYWAMLTLGPVLVGVSLSVTYYLIGLSKGWVGAIPVSEHALLGVVPLLLATIAFSLLYLTVPNRFVPRRDALIGGFSVALAFEVMKRGFAAYVASVPTYKLVYGAFASFPIFLLWLYCCWLIILVGAEVTASLSHWQGGRWHVGESPEQRYYDALRILKVLHRAHRSGEVVPLARLRRSLPHGIDHLEDLLERLGGAHIVQKVAGDGYAMIRDPSTIQLADIYRLFVLQHGRSMPNHALPDAEFAPLLQEVAENVEGCMRLTLDSVFAQAADSEAIQEVKP